jgi:hypothetical protein
VIVGFEPLRRRQLAGEEAGCERHTRQNTDLAPLALAKEELRGPLPKDVVDDLYRLHVRILERL